jgi:HD superfamily phosphohydrolase
LHTRFHHAMGAMYLMGEAIEEIRSKGHDITEEEAKAVTIAILLHDIGHGPFSHALEHSIVNNVTHEDISELFMSRLNEEFKGELTLAIKIFKNKYHKKFLHQLVSSQLDMDRLDYLKRDSFFTGVSEGVVSSDRIIKMLNFVNDQLAIEAKGIYSIEKFIIARRLMYWQVYLHKTVLSAENLLVNILKRAKELAEKKVDLFCTPSLKIFLYHQYSKKDFTLKPELLDAFADLDDNDIMTSIKVWAKHKDPVLSMLCSNLVNRKLFKVEMQSQPFTSHKINKLKNEIKKRYKLNDKEINYFVFTGTVANDAYRADKIGIDILFKDGSYLDITKASDQLNIDVLSKTVKKYYLCFPKAIEE